MRPGALAVYPNGFPFYCGKTVRSVERRFERHKYDALRYWPKRKMTIAMLSCGESVRIETVEIVSPTDDWRAREKHWVTELRKINPDCANISDGGDGVPGHVPTQSTRAKLSAANKGRKLPPAQIESLRRIHLGSKHSPETCAKRGAAHRGMKRPPGTGEKIGMAHRGMVRSDAAREKMRAAKLGRKQSPEHVANMRAAITGKPKSESHRAALKAAWVIRRLKSARPEGVPVLAFESDRRPAWERRSGEDIFAGVSR